MKVSFPGLLPALEYGFGSKGLNVWTMICGIFLCMLLEVFSGDSGFLPYSSINGFSK